MSDKAIWENPSEQVHGGFAQRRVRSPMGQLCQSPSERAHGLGMARLASADSCTRHGYCIAELIIWYNMKQLTLLPDVNEVTMQKEILTPPKIPPATVDQASK